MAFDPEKMEQPVTRLEIAALALPLVGALQATRWALHALEKGRDAEGELALLARQVDDCLKKWEEFSGWGDKE